MYENLMTRIGPVSWSTNFTHDELYDYEDVNNQKGIDQNENYVNWSKGYRPIPLGPINIIFILIDTFLIVYIFIII